MPDNSGNSSATLTEAQLLMLRLIAMDKPLPWDPQSLVRLQALHLIARAAGSSYWTVTDLGVALLDEIGGPGPSAGDGTRTN